MAAIVVQNRQGGLFYLLLRVVYFVVIGLWLSGIWAAVAWLLCVTIIGLPIGLWMLDRLPQVSTLQPQRNDLVITTDGRTMSRQIAQHPWILRAVYFVLVGWWLSALWLTVAWALCSVVIGLPFGFWMMNRVPGVLTLART
jgi:uncharacterized membrane protein YccF (DUF307 family)